MFDSKLSLKPPDFNDFSLFKRAEFNLQMQQNSD